MEQSIKQQQWEQPSEQELARRKNIKLLKEDIKKLAAEQPELRNQRKSIHFTGERKIPPSSAVAQHLHNRFEIRHMGLAYGIMRGRTIEQMEPKVRKDNKHIQSLVDDLIKKYDVPAKPKTEAVYNNA